MVTDPTRLVRLLRGGRAGEESNQAAFMIADDISDVLGVRPFAEFTLNGVKNLTTQHS